MTAAPVPPAHVVGIYRHRKAGHLVELLRPEVRPSWSMALWALDDVDPQLAAWTVGCGPGGKFDLLNAILERAPAQPGQHLLVTDDDITLPGSGLSALLTAMVAAGLDLAQPAHRADSSFSHPITRRQRLARARLTTFVEIGPVFAVAAPWVPQFAPFPADHGMGWGLELLWSRLRQHGCRLGIVDATTVLHPERPNVSYAGSLDAEYAQLDRLLAEDGYANLEQAQQVLATWWRWQRQPSWLRADRAGAPDHGTGSSQGGSLLPR